MDALDDPNLDLSDFQKIAAMELGWDVVSALTDAVHFELRMKGEIDTPEWCTPDIYSAYQHILDCTNMDPADLWDHIKSIVKPGGSNV